MLPKTSRVSEAYHSHLFLFSNSMKVVVSDVPTSVEMESLEEAFSKFGTVQAVIEDQQHTNRRTMTNSHKTDKGNPDSPDGDDEKSNAEDKNGNESSSSARKTVVVTYSSRIEAEEAVKGLNGTEIDGVRVNVSSFFGFSDF